MPTHTPRLIAAATAILTLAVPALAHAVPKARYDYSPTTPTTGLSTSFDASRTSCDRKPCSFRWQDDGSDGAGGTNTTLGTGMRLAYTFMSPGRKDVRLTVTNARGQSGTTVQTVQVADAAPPPPPPPPPAACANGLDDDGDGLVDLGDPGCTSALDTDETNVVQSPPPPPPADPQVALTPVDGGPGYYGRFSNGLPTGADYFPIGVWGSYDLTQTNVATDKSRGLNLYVWIGNSTLDPSRLQNLRDAGMNAIHPVDEKNLWTEGTESAGWLGTDEIDMQQANSQGAAIARTELARLRSLAPDSRAFYNNYGKGVAFWNSDSDAEQYINDFQDLQSVDVYWHTDPGGACTQWEGGKIVNNTRSLTEAECRRSSNYGWTVDRMRYLDGLDGQRKPIWNFVEVGCPFSNGDCITAPQVRAAVWHSIIAGARGVIYFNHSFGGSCITHHVLRSSCGGYPAIQSTVTGVDALVKQLAPVLNASSVTTGVQTSQSVRSLVKWQGGKFYVFAGAKENTSSTGTVTIPCVGNATATVLDEGRTVPVQNGQISDQFADGNAVHIYRIDGGSSCGLAP